MQSSKFAPSSENEEKIASVRSRFFVKTKKLEERRPWYIHILINAK